MHHAISKDDIHKARVLIQHKADTDVRTFTGLTPYELAGSNQLKMLLSDKSDIPDGFSEEGFSQDGKMRK